MLLFVPLFLLYIVAQFLLAQLDPAAISAPLYPQYTRGVGRGQETPLTLSARFASLGTDSSFTSGDDSEVRALIFGRGARRTQSSVTPGLPGWGR